jgi:hypothetical protein
MDWRWPGVILLVLIATACSSSKPHAKTTTTIAAVTTTTDPYAIPATIDVPYVQRVIDAIDPLLGKAAQALVRDRAISADYLHYLRAASDELGERATRDGDLYELAAKLKDYKPQPGQPRSQVLSILVATPRCVFAKVHRDSSEIISLPGASADKFVELLPRNPARDPQAINPTPWVIDLVSDVPYSRGKKTPCSDA